MKILRQQTYLFDNGLRESLAHSCGRLAAAQLPRQRRNGEEIKCDEADGFGGEGSRGKKVSEFEKVEEKRCK